jgi:Domain of unknown function (DUF5710)
MGPGKGRSRDKRSPAGEFFTVSSSCHQEAAECGAVWDSETKTFYAEEHLTIALMHGIDGARQVPVPSPAKGRPQAEKKRPKPNPKAPERRAPDVSQSAQRSSMAPKTPSPAKRREPDVSTKEPRYSSPRDDEEPSRAYFAIPFHEKEEAKPMGARWNPAKKLWCEHRTHACAHATVQSGCATVTVQRLNGCRRARLHHSAAAAACRAASATSAPPTPHARRRKPAHINRAAAQHVCGSGVLAV